MAKPTASNQNRLRGSLLFAVSMIFCMSASGQVVLKKQVLDHKAVLSLVQPDTVPIKTPKLLLDFKNIFRPALKELKSSIIEQFSIKNQWRGLAERLRNPVIFHQGDLSSQSSYDNIYIGDQQFYSRSYFNLSSSWSVAGIPLNVGSRIQSWSAFNTQEIFQYDFQFDKDEYLKQLKNKLAGKIDPSALIKQFKNPLDNVISDARKALMDELKNLNDSYRGLLKDEISQVNSLPDLLTGDIRSLKARYFSMEAINNLKAKEALLSSLQQQQNNGLGIDTVLAGNLASDIEKMNGLHLLLTKIEQHKNRWEQSGLVSKIKEFDLFKQTSLSNLLSEPEVVTKLAKQTLSLSGIQRFFLRVNHLKVGQNSLSASPLSFHHFLSKGINTSIITKGKSLLLLAGKQTDFNSVLDLPFTQSPFSNNGFVKAFGIRSGENKRLTTDMSISSFSQAMAALPGVYTPSSLRQVLVTTIGNRLALGDKGLVSFEISRSATSYSQQRSSNNDSVIGEKGSLARVLATGNFMSNTAISFKYADELTDQGLTYQLHFSKTANGYTNPGNGFLNAGSTEAGVGFRKFMLKGKFIMSVKANARMFRYGERNDAKWLNQYMVLDLKWKLKKGQYLAMKYQPVTMVRKQAGDKEVISSFQRLGMDASVYKKFGTIGYRNFISLALQKNDFRQSLNADVKSSSIVLTSFQQLVFGKRTLYANLSINQANSTEGLLYLQSSFYSEVGYSYSLFKRISASSGLTYTTADAWYKQVGFRQTINTLLSDKFSFNFYLDMKENIEQVQPLWDGPVRADISLKYFFNNKN